LGYPLTIFSSGLGSLAAEKGVMRMNWQKKLNTALGLKIEGQDWGIENADPLRVNEFIAFFDSNSISDPWEPEALAELIFQSAQEAFEKDLLSVLDQRLLLSFYAKHRHKFPITENYWLSREKSEWRITQLLSNEKKGA
jgi:hypothetical protein